MNENTMERSNMMMEHEEENMNRRKANAVSDSSMPMSSHLTRTPLMDVKNQFRVKARQRMSTGSMKSSDFSFKHRLSLNDQESVENTQGHAKFFKEPNDKGEGKVALMLPVTHSDNEEDSASTLSVSSCHVSTSADIVDNVLQEKVGELSIGADEISRDGEFLKDIMSVLDQDLEISNGFSEDPSEQENIFVNPSLGTSEIHDDSIVESTQQILSDIQALELEETFKGKEFDSIEGFGEHVSVDDRNQIDLALHFEASVLESDETLQDFTSKGKIDVSLPVDLSISEESTTLLEPEIDSEGHLSQLAGNSFGHLSSSFKESLDDTGIMLTSSRDLDIIAVNFHELSSIRLVEGCEDSTLDILLEDTLTEEMQDFGLHRGEITAMQNSSGERYLLSEMAGAEGFVADRNLVEACHLNETAGDEETDNLTESSGSLLVDLSISEAEALNCFDCTADMSKFIDEFLKETPVLEKCQGRPVRFKPQTVGKRDDMWPGEKDGDDFDSSQDDSSVLKAVQHGITRNEHGSIENVGHISPIPPLSEEIGEVIDASFVANEQLLEKEKAIAVKDEEDNARPLPEGELSDRVDSNLKGSDEVSCTILGDENSVDRDVSSESLSVKPVKVPDNICESDVLYSFRVSKVLETLREACVTSNVEESSELKLPLEIPKCSVDMESLSKVETGDEKAVVVTKELEVESVLGQNLPANEETELLENVVDDGSTTDVLQPVTCGEETSDLENNSESTDLVEGLETGLLCESDKMLPIEPDELETVAEDTDSSSESDENTSNISKQRQSLNRSSVEMKEEIKTLESQMAEMKQKVAWLESQIEMNQHEGNEHNLQNHNVQSRNVSLMPEPNVEALRENGSDSQLNHKKKLMDDLEDQLTEELQKTKELERYVKDVEKKCSLFEKERLNSELNFAKEVRRLKAEYSQSVSHQQAEEEERVELMHQEFDCMMLEFERLTTLQKKMKDMLNRVMRTTNESLTGYAKLLKDYSMLQHNHQSVETELSRSKADNKKLAEDVEVLENLLLRSNDSIKDLHQLYQEEIENLKSQVSSLSEALDVAAKEKEATMKGLDDHVAQLQQSLDRLESERHIGQEELEDTKFLLEHQKTKNQSLSEEVDELRKIKVDWVAGQDWIKELQDTISFLNEEREASDAEYEMTKKKIARLEAELKSLIQSNKEYQNTQHQLQTEMSALRERLYATGEDATMLLAALEDIESRAESLLDTLQQKFGNESCNSAKATPKQPLGQNSLVAQVLGRIGVDDSQLRNTCSKLSSVKSKCRQRNFNNSSVKEVNSALSGVANNSLFSSSSHSSTRVPSSRKALNFSSPIDTAAGKQNSAVPSSQIYESNVGATSQDGGDGSNTSIPGFAHIRSIPLSGKKCEEEERLSPSQDFNVLEICENVLESIDHKFSVILKIAHSTDRVSKIKIRDLKGEVGLLTDKCKMKRDLSEKLDAELESKRHQLGESRAEIEQLNDRVNRMTQVILQHEDVTYEVKRLEEDNHDLQQEIMSLKGERDMLSTQVQGLITKASGGEGEQASLKKIAALEKRIYQINRFWLQEQEKTTEKGDKAMRRIRVLELNLKRAEEEVYKFDELVEAIRNTCIENRSMRTHPALLHVVRLIDGLVEIEKKPSTDRTKDSSKAPVKTPTSTPRMSSSVMSSNSTRTKKGEEYPV